MAHARLCPHRFGVGELVLLVDKSFLEVKQPSVQLILSRFAFLRAMIYRFLIFSGINLIVDCVPENANFEVLQYWSFLAMLSQVEEMTRNSRL